MSVNKVQQSLAQSAGRSGDAIYAAVADILSDREKPENFLDFGAGQGFLIKHLAELNFLKSGTGLDLLSKPNDLPKAFDWHQADLNLPVDLAEDSFELLTGIEIIEHLENPRSTAREWHRLLKPGGFLICSTPNNLSLRSLISLFFRKHFLEFGPRSYPSHITALLPIDLERILTEAGFTDIRVGYTNSGRIPKLLKLSWQDVSFGLLKGRLFSDNVVVSAVKPR